MVFKDRIRTAEEAFAYMTDCTLATVSSLAMKKSRSKGEYERQILIAQTGVDLMRFGGFGSHDTRAAEIISDFGGSVKSWAQQYEPLTH